MVPTECRAVMEGFYRFGVMAWGIESVLCASE